MKIETIGTGVPFQDLAPGTFFSFQHRELEFAMCIAEGAIKAAIVMSLPDQHGRRPWFAESWEANDGCIAYPSAVIRPRLAGVALQGHGYGVIYSIAGKHFIRAAAPHGRYLTINLESGIVEPLPEGKPTAIFPSWDVGIVQDTAFLPIFSFPPDAT